MTPAHNPHGPSLATNSPQSPTNLPWHSAYAEAGIDPDLPALAYHSLAELVQSSCERFTNQTAFTCVVPNGMNGSLSFAQVNEHSDAFAV